MNFPLIKLIRLPNLIIILFTQYMIRFAFLYPYFKIQGFSLQLSEPVFLVFSLAFVFMAASGYIINDYYDVEADKINKPGKVFIGNTVSRGIALWFYWIFCIVGLAMGSWSSAKIGLPGLGLLFFFYATGLWFYSTTFKYIFLLGNILVSLFIGLVPLTAGFVELYAGIQQAMQINADVDFSSVLKAIEAISVFAFLVTFAREIVKDMEDMEGDAKAGCRTLPIVLGIKACKIFTLFILLMLFSLVSILLLKCWNAKGWLSVAYISGFIELPLLVLAFGLNKANSKPGFHKISNGLKFLMVSGISYLFVFAYVCLH
ncbi:MAG: geranylgeranylglycerol-phosphate geranylgeranyltransferase [Bacteroidia bacterium]